MVTGRPPLIDLALERQVQAFLRQAIAANLVNSAHDLSDGGLAVAVAECCMASGLGARLELPPSGARLDRLLFAEGGARILVSVAQAQAQRWQAALAAAAVPSQPIGTVTALASLTISQAGSLLVDQDVEALQTCYEQAIPRRMGGDLVQNGRSL